MPEWLRQYNSLSYNSHSKSKGIFSGFHFFVQYWGFLCSFALFLRNGLVAFYERGVTYITVKQVSDFSSFLKDNYVITFIDWVLFSSGSSPWPSVPMPLGPSSTLWWWLCRNLDLSVGSLSSQFIISTSFLPSNSAAQVASLWVSYKYEGLADSNGNLSSFRICSIMVYVNKLNQKSYLSLLKQNKNRKSLGSQNP